MAAPSPEVPLRSTSGYRISPFQGLIEHSKVRLTTIIL